MAKTVFILLAFHGHEPLWDWASMVLKDVVQDEEMRNSVPSENWIKKRAEQHRDVYSDLVRFSQDLNVPVILEATNELLVQIAEYAPDTHTTLQRAYRDGRLYPVYGHAHHAHIALLKDEEVRDEIRLNQEYIHRVMRAPEPRYRGLFPPEDSIDATKLRGIADAGIDFVIFPNLSPRKAHYSVDRGLNQCHEPFLFGPDFIALPRHFAVSQDIWRPVTKMRPEGVKNQGYILGRYWVFDEEYRRRKYVKYPIDERTAIDEYKLVLQKALADAPEGGMILYVQDLELMDFGDIALRVMSGAWRELKQDKRFDLRFVTPDEYIEQVVQPQKANLARMRFHQISWAPEIRLVLRYDGHYPPLNAGKYRERDLVPEVFRRWPFIFWEPGRYIAELINQLFRMFSYDLAIPESADHLAAIKYGPLAMTEDVRLRVHARTMKRACNWGWFPNEGLQKRPFLHGYAIAGILLRRLEQEQVALQVASNLGPLDDSIFRGLAAILEVIVDTRYNYLLNGTARTQCGVDRECRHALSELALVRQFRDEAQHHISLARERCKGLEDASQADNLDTLRSVIASFRDYCRATFLAIDHIQRTWIDVPDVDALLTAMYDYLYQLYPPRFPAILESTLSEQQLAESLHPPLL